MGGREGGGWQTLEIYTMHGLDHLKAEQTEGASYVLEPNIIMAKMMEGEHKLTGVRLIRQPNRSEITIEDFSFGDTESPLTT